MTPDTLRKYFDYTPETGELFWRVTRKGPGCAAGRRAGTINRRRDTNYRAVTLFGKKLYAHRVAWQIVNGPIPEGLCIDHIDGDGLNNRLDNLRLTSLSGNHSNSRRYRSNSTGVVGVSATRSGYAAHIRGQYLGHFPDLESARSVRKAAEAEHGFHENHGRTA